MLELVAFLHQAAEKNAVFAFNEFNDDWFKTYKTHVHSGTTSYAFINDLLGLWWLNGAGGGPAEAGIARQQLGCSGQADKDKCSVPTLTLNGVTDPYNCGGCRGPWSGDDGRCNVTIVGNWRSCKGGNCFSVTPFTQYAPCLKRMAHEHGTWAREWVLPEDSLNIALHIREGDQPMHAAQGDAFFPNIISRLAPVVKHFRKVKFTFFGPGSKIGTMVRQPTLQAEGKARDTKEECTKPSEFLVRDISKHINAVFTGSDTQVTIQAPCSSVLASIKQMMQSDIVVTGGSSFILMVALFSSRVLILSQSTLGLGIDLGRDGTFAGNPTTTDLLTQLCDNMLRY